MSIPVVFNLFLHFKNMELSKALTERRSIREYAGEKVGDEQLMEILEAGRWAPSGLNNQPWKFMILRGQIKDSLAHMTKYGRTITSADACIAVFLDGNAIYNREKDLQAVGACIQNMLLKIHGLGLGGVWLGEILNKKDEVQETLETHYELMAVIAVGHPKEKGQSQRKKIEELII
jgi:nitroreductase